MQCFPLRASATNANIASQLISTDVAPNTTRHEACWSPPSPIHPIPRRLNMTFHNTTPLAQRRTGPFALLPRPRRRLQTFPLSPTCPCTHVVVTQSVPETRSGLEWRPPVMQPKIGRDMGGWKACRAAVAQWCRLPFSDPPSSPTPGSSPKPAVQGRVRY